MRDRHTVDHLTEAGLRKEVRDQERTEPGNGAEGWVFKCYL